MEMWTIEKSEKVKVETIEVLLQHRICVPHGKSVLHKANRIFVLIVNPNDYFCHFYPLSEACKTY